MTKTALTILAVTSTLVLGGMVRANATIITETYDFTASGFGGASPADPWSGSFKITFDPTASGFVGPFALDAPLSSNLPASFSPFVALQDGNFIVIGDDCLGAPVNNCFSGSGQAFLDFFVDASGNPSASVAFINNTGGSNLAVTLASTPLPAALPLFATGLGALGLLGWRRKRKAQAVA